MVGREAKRVKVLVDRDDRIEVVVVGVSGRGEGRFDYLAGEADGVGGLEVEFAREVGEDCGGHVSPVVCSIFTAVDLQKVATGVGWTLLVAFSNLKGGTDLLFDIGIEAVAAQGAWSWRISALLAAPMQA